MSSAVVILAAGASTRLGRPKQLLIYQGNTLLRRAADTALAAECGPVAVVLGAKNELLEQEIRPMALKILSNPDWEKGMGTSIRVAVEFAKSSDAVVLMLCDQPLITSANIQELVRKREVSGKAICAAAYGGSLGTPAVFSSAIFDELMKLADDEGGKSVISRHMADTAVVDMPNAAKDIDTEEDVAGLA